MRLYSQRIIYLTLALGVILGLVLGLILGSSSFFISTENSRDPETVQSVQTLPPSIEKELSHPVTPVQAGTDYSQDELNSITVYERVNDAVVHITTEVVRLNWFLEPIPSEGGTGSGSIIDTRGYVLTNNHVVEGASRLFVNLSDGTQFEAEIVGSDPESDLAVIKFNPGNRQLPTIPLGSSEGLRVGQKVLAIGNPFGFDRTLTTGIVSALGRPIQGRNGLIIQGMIQTDASINPGNSGGPLLNSRGEMIGINTMIYSTSGGSVGIGFAVPVNTAKRVVPDLIQFGNVQRGWIDAVPVQIFPALVRVGRLPVSKGLLVSQVIPGGAADRAGIRGGSRDRAIQYGRSIIYLGGDIIQNVAGQEVSSIGQLFSVLETSKPGDKIEIGLVRANGQRQNVTLTLSLRPKDLTF
jgi:S1-C subfamily serine protease